MILHNLIGATIGLVTGAAMAVALSSVWTVLMIPARIQDLFRVTSSRTLTFAMWLGLTLCALGNGADFTLSLPAPFGWAALMMGGVFVGMLASALGEILEVVPVMMRRFQLGHVSHAVRWTLLVGKALGALIASLVFTLS